MQFIESHVPFTKACYTALHRYLTSKLTPLRVVITIKPLLRTETSWTFSQRKVINTVISILWAEPIFKIVFGTLTWSLRRRGHLVMLIICFHHSWLIAEATRLMRVQCDWHFDSIIASQLGIQTGRVYSKYKYHVHYVFKWAADLSFHHARSLLDKDQEHLRACM